MQEEVWKEKSWSIQDEFKWLTMGIKIIKAVKNLLYEIFKNGINVVKGN